MRTEPTHARLVAAIMLDFLKQSRDCVVFVRQAPRRCIAKIES